MQYAELKRQAGKRTYENFIVLHGHLKRYRDDIQLHQVDKVYIDGFLEYMKAVTGQRGKFSDETIRYYKRNLVTVLNFAVNGAVKNIKTWTA